MRLARLKGLVLAALLAGASLAIPEYAEAVPVEKTLPVGSLSTSEAVPLTYSWDQDWFRRDSYLYNHQLARVCGALSSTVYLQDSGALTRLWSELGGQADSIRDYHYKMVEPEYKDKSAYSFGLMDLPGGRTLVLVAIRGTNGQQEWISNLNMADSTQRKQRYHEGFEKSARLLLQDLYDYLQAEGVEPDTACFLITGHSRGAAVADLVGAFLDRQEPAEDGRVYAVSPEQVYTYTFATPSSCTVIGERRAGLYHNIFNIINPEDAVPELPFKGGSWDYGNFGVSLYLPTATKLKGDRERYDQLAADMSVTFSQLTGRTFKPMPHSEDFARAVKNMQWVVGSVEKFYKRRGKLGHSGMVHAIEKTMPVTEDGQQTGNVAGITEVLQEKNPEVAQAALNMHSADTYNAWILSEEPHKLYMRGTPTLCRLQVTAEGGQQTRVKLLEGQIPLEITLSLPEGEAVSAYKDGEVSQQPHSVDPELKSYSRMATFIVPEGERLEVQVKAPQEGGKIAFELATTLEANRENGLDKMQKPLSSVQRTLKPGESASFVIDNREAKEVKEKKAKP